MEGKGRAAPPRGPIAAGRRPAETGEARGSLNGDFNEGRNRRKDSRGFDRGEFDMRTTTLAVLIALAFASPVQAEPDWKAVGQALGKEGAVAAGGVYRVGLPRTDLKVTLDGVEIKPGFALGSWLAFKAVGNEAMVMGDLVLTHDEVNPVMKKLLENGMEVTALHNHLLRSEPGTMYMHVAGHGDSVKLAAALHDGLAQSKTPMGAAAPAAQAAPEGVGDRHQFPGNRRRQGRDHRRFRAHRRRGQSGPEGPARERHRSDGDPQPHARRRAAPVLHAFLGERRSAEAGTTAARSARPREDQKGLATGYDVWLCPAPVRFKAGSLEEPDCCTIRDWGASAAGFGQSPPFARELRMEVSLAGLPHH